METVIASLSHRVTVSLSFLKLFCNKKKNQWTCYCLLIDYISLRPIYFAWLVVHQLTCLVSVALASSMFYTPWSSKNDFFFFFFFNLLFLLKCICIGSTKRGEQHLHGVSCALASTRINMCFLKFVYKRPFATNTIMLLLIVYFGNVLWTLDKT